MHHRGPSDLRVAHMVDPARQAIFGARLRFRGQLSGAHAKLAVIHTRDDRQRDPRTAAAYPGERLDQGLADGEEVVR